MWAGDAQASTAATSLDLLLGSKDYNRLEQALPAVEASLTPDELAYFDAIMANRLNQVDLSTRLLETLVPALLLSNVLHAENALCTLADSYAKSFRYSDAATTYAQAATFSQSRGASSLCDAGREAKRWALLSTLPPQTVEMSGSFSLKSAKDSIGLVRVPVVAGNYEGSWIVDTGASVSIISRTVAEQMGLSLLPGSESGEGSSGKFVPVHVALIAELHLGTAVLRNVPVLVAEDSDLTFSSLDYKINGCLGLPVLAALGSFTVSRDGSVYVRQADGLGAEPAQFVSRAADSGHHR